MASVVGEAGGSALRRSIRMRAALPVCLLSFLLVMGIAVTIAFARSTAPVPLALFTIVAVAVSFGRMKNDLHELYDLSVESRDWAKGAAGERITAKDLTQLPAEYLVLNDLHPSFRGPVATWNWDHVVIGPTGIFVIDAKYYSATRIRDAGTDARTRRNVRQVGSYARAFKSELVRLNSGLNDLFIIPMLAYAHEGTWVEKIRQGDVRVLPLRLARNDILNYSRSTLTATEALKIAHLLFNMYEPLVQDEYREQYLTWARAVRASDWIAAGSTTKDERKPAMEEQLPKAFVCPICGTGMIRREGSYGAFYGCAKYHETGCRGRRTLEGTAK